MQIRSVKKGQYPTDVPNKRKEKTERREFEKKYKNGFYN